MTSSMSVIAAAVWLGLAGHAIAQPADGRWLGVFGDRETGLHLGIDLHKAADGTYAGVFDSPDQGAWNLPVVNATVSSNTLTFALSNPVAHYVGRWDAGRHGWVGHWIQGGRSTPLTLARTVLPTAPRIDGLEGDWDGVVDRNGAHLRFALDFHVLPRGGYRAVIDSIDQFAVFPIATFARNGPTIHLEAPLIGMTIEGKLDQGGQAIIGTWRKGSEGGSITFARRPTSAPRPVANRPQIPTKPYPYREEEVVYSNPAAGVRLAGTLTLPSGPGPHPAVILIAGSGRSTRNEPALGHQIFLVLADYLTRRGVAVLRVDKRGLGASTGDYDKATTNDFASDVRAGLAYLRSLADIDPNKIGLIGHSEGGIIAPMVAAGDKQIAFMVLLAAPAQTGATISVEQTRLVARADGLNSADVDRRVALQRRLIELVRRPTDPERTAADVRKLLAGSGFTQAEADAMVETFAGNWGRFFLDYDPVAALRSVTCPVLAVGGNKDLQVPATPNLAIIKAALAGDPDATVVELPGINHALQAARIGSPTEYAEIEESISPAVLGLVSGWINAHVSLAQP